MNKRQEIGRALEQLAYEELREQLRSKLGTTGGEQKTKKGIVWKAKPFYLFWNRQVIKQGAHIETIIRRQTIKPIGAWKKTFPDLVLCDTNKPPSKLDDPNTYPEAILAIELKNTNLDYKWTSAWLFDRDVMSRFIWGGVDGVLSMDDDYGGGWEKYAGPSNLYPNAIKVLITPKFAYHPNALTVPPREEPDELTKPIIENKIQRGIRPPTWSEKDKIQWRIGRLKLQIHELGYQPKPSEQVPESVRGRTREFLHPYVESLIAG